MNPIDSIDKKPGLMLSLRESLGEHYDDFIENFVRKSIKEAVAQGKIDIYTLKSINKALKKKGTKIFDVPIIKRTYVTKNTVEGGEIFEVKLPIPNYSVISLFVKIFPDKKRYERAVETQMDVHQYILVDNVPGASELEKLIVPLSYKNDNLGLVAYPLINAESLAEKNLSLMDAEQKEKLLKQAINAHQRFSIVLTKNIHSLESKFTAPSAFYELMSADESFDKLFFSRIDKYGSIKPGEEKTRSELRASLNDIISDEFKALDHSSHNQIIHPDLNPGNVLIGEDGVKIIDYEELSLGFQEFAYGKLLTKAGIDISLETKLVKWAAQNQARLEYRSASEDEINSSVKRYELNRISQELFTAARYLKRAHEQDNSNESNTMRRMADVSYTLALRRIKSAEEKGILGNEFRVLIEKYNSLLLQDGLKEITQDQEHIMQQYNPHLKCSQENMASAHTLDFMVTGAPQVEITKELKLFDKYMSRGKKKTSRTKIAAYAAIPLALISLAAGAGLYFTSKNANKANITLVAATGNLDLVARISQLNAVREAPLSTTIITSKKYLEYLNQVYNDPKTAELFFISPNMAYEAMQETHSKDYSVLEKYLQNNHREFWTRVFAQITGYVDNWAWQTTTKDMKGQYDMSLGLAKQAYKENKNAPAPAVQK